MLTIPCTYLGSDVELADERQQHILEKHPDLLPEQFDRIVETVADPDEVRCDERFPGTHLFSRWYEDVSRGKYIVVVIVSDGRPAQRHWIVTAYLTQRVRQGVTEWKRN